MSDITLPTFNWEHPAEEALTRINEYLETYNPQSQHFQSELYNLLLDLAGHVEAKVTEVYRERENQATRESTQENMKLISHILSGDVIITHREEE